MLEVLANTTAEDLLARDYHLMRVTLPESQVHPLPANALPPGWNSPQRIQATMHLGDSWLSARTTAALRVPSALVPLEVADSEYNLVLNPLHPLYQKVQVTAVIRLPFDPRL